MAAQLDEIYRYQAISDRLGTAGQPTREQFSAIADAGYEVVVNLRTPDGEDWLADERELVHELGMAYVHISVVWTAPDLEDLRQFMDVMDLYAGRKVFVHCAANARVSCFVYLYRVLRQGMDRERAMANLLKVWTPNATWSRFIKEAREQGDVES